MRKGSETTTILLFFLRMFLFWMVLFQIMRSFFLLFNFKELAGIPIGEILLSFVNALPLDISATSYLMLLPVIITLIGTSVKKGEPLFRTAHSVNHILIILYLIIFFSGMALYLNWGTKINSKALSFIIYPKEILAIIFDWYNLLFFVIFLAALFATVLFYKKFVGKISFTYPKKWKPIVFVIIVTGLLFIGMRGGVQKYPINKSRCFYSSHSVLNFAAINDFWNFLSILVKPEIKQNPYTYLDNAKAEKIIRDLYHVKKDTTEFLFTTPRPNIVLIVLESFSADAVYSFGGKQGIAPYMDTLAKEGLIFTDFYATGFRTDQGLVAILSGFPGQPRSSIIKNFEKFDKLPNLIKTLGENGYYTSYYFGGDLKYANSESYLKVAGTHRIISQDDIPHTKRTDWGAYDEDVFNYQLNDLKNNTHPFFSMMLTLTNHEYFEADVEKVFPGKTENDLYHNTAHYTDKCLYKFITEAKNQPWYANTVFIITADHAHRHPLERRYNEPARHHIPLLIYGNALKPQYRGKTISKTGMHIDLAATILAQLKIASNEYKWSKNLMNKYVPGFAFYTFDDGFGFVTDSCEVIFDHNMKKVIESKTKIPGANCLPAADYGKAMLQLTFQQYVDL